MREIPALLIAIVLLVVPVSAGFSVSYALVSPDGNLTDGSLVTVTCEIPRDGILTGDQLVLATDLMEPAWDPVVMVRGQETAVKPASATENSITINGAIFRYPAPVKANLRVRLTGTVPPNHTTSQRLLAVNQIDSEGTPYAYPTGYTLPMPGAPSGEPAQPPQVLSTPLIIPVYTVPAETTPVLFPADTEAAGPAPATEKPVNVRTPFPAATTPAAAAPAGPLSGITAAVIALCLAQHAARR